MNSANVTLISIAEAIVQTMQCGERSSRSDVTLLVHTDRTLVCLLRAVINENRVCLASDELNREVQLQCGNPSGQLCR